MKFSEMTYTRPDIDALLARCKELTAKAAAADSGEALVEVYYEQSRAFADYNTAFHKSLCNFLNIVNQSYYFSLSIVIFPYFVISCNYFSARYSLIDFINFVLKFKNNLYIVIPIH